jgi:hypothetical protein
VFGELIYWSKQSVESHSWHVGVPAPVIRPPQKLRQEGASYAQRFADDEDHGAKANRYATMIL